MTLRSPAFSTISSKHLAWISSLFLLMGWLAPDHIPPWESFYNEFSAFLALGALLILIALNHAGTQPAVSRWATAIFLVACIPLVQTWTGLVFFSGDGWLATFYITALGLAYIAGHTLFKTYSFQFTTLLASLFVAAAVLSVFISLAQWLEITGFDLLVYRGSSANRPGANLGQPNQLATLICLGLAGLLYLFSREHLNTSTTLLLGCLLIFGVVLTQSRLVWLSAVIFPLWWTLSGRRYGLASGWCLATGLFIYIGLFLLWPVVTATDLAFSGSGYRSDLTEPGTRTVIWSGLLQAIWLEPLTGYGWNQVSTAHILTASNYPLPELVTYSHNLILDLLIWAGIPLALIILGGITYWLMMNAWRCRTSESWFGILAIAIVGIHSMLEYPHAYAYFLLPVGLMAGMVDAQQNDSNLLRLPRPLLLAFAIAYLTTLSLVWHEYRIIEDDYRLARFEERRIGHLTANQLTPDIVLLTQLREDIRYMRTRAQPDMDMEKLAWMQRVTYRYPYYSNLFRYGLALALNNQHDAAVIEFHRLYNLYGEKPFVKAIEALCILQSGGYPQLDALMKQINALRVPDNARICE